MRIPRGVELRFPGAIAGTIRDEPRSSGAASGARSIALGDGRSGQPVAAGASGAAGVVVRGRSGPGRLLRPDQSARRHGGASGERSGGAVGGMAVCDPGGDRRSAGDRTSVRASCGVSLAVRRRSGEPRHAVGLPPRQRTRTGPAADPEPDRADRGRLGDAGRGDHRRHENPGAAPVGVRCPKPSG